MRHPAIFKQPNSFGDFLFEPDGVAIKVNMDQTPIKRNSPAVNILRGAQYTLPSDRRIPDCIFVKIAAADIRLALAPTGGAPPGRNHFRRGSGTSTANGIAFHVLVEHLVGVEVGAVAGEAGPFDPLRRCALPRGTHPPPDLVSPYFHKDSVRSAAL